MQLPTTAETKTNYLMTEASDTPIVAHFIVKEDNTYHEQKKKDQKITE